MLVIGVIIHPFLISITASPLFLSSQIFKIQNVPKYIHKYKLERTFYGELIKGILTSIFAIY